MRVRWINPSQFRWSIGIEGGRGRIEISLWRRKVTIEWKVRVLCGGVVNGRQCRRPAVMKCVSGNLGVDYPRDPLCAEHGNLGYCRADHHAVHAVLIPPEERYWYEE